MPIWTPARKKILGNPTTAAMLGTPISVLERLLFVNPLLQVYGRVKRDDDRDILETLLREMRIRVQVTPADLNRVPTSGAALVVANHPFGILDGAVLGAVLTRVRKDVKMLANYLVSAVDELHDFCINLDPFARASSHQVNTAGLRKAVAHLKNGGMLAMFPAGEVSHWQFRHGEITDPEWSPVVVRLARLTGAPIVPVFFEGHNSLPFHLLGVLHPRLRTVQLSREFLIKEGKEASVRIGTPVTAERLCRIRNDQQATSYVRWRTYLLRRREAEATSVQPDCPRPVLSPVRGTEVISEIESLSPGAVLDESRDFRVFIAEAVQIPQTLVEIGRQRELAFRKAGEGTGQDVDIDRFDVYYKHLILWHKKDQQVAGGYRLVNTADVLPTRGLEGLYTSTLFWIDPAFFDHTGPALELGRSYIQVRYQKHYSALLMLWRGIASYVSSHPQTPVLFGPVSISSAYNRTSRELLFGFFKSQRGNPLSQWIRPRRPFRSRPMAEWELRAMRYLLDLEEMSSSISEIESDGKGIPVLLRQYLKLGGELLAFNVDKNFSNVLDGLVIVDLRRTDPSRLEAYMGKHGVARFLERHAVVEPYLHVD